MSEEKKKRGRKKSGRALARGINFSVSAEDYEWLNALNKRSEWLAQKIEEDRATSNFGVTRGDTPTNKRPADDVEPSNGAQ